VEVADNANNTVTVFGKYGNQNDDGARGEERGTRPEGTAQGAGATPRTSSPAPRPIPLAWPTYVAVSDDYAYVNDTIGMRVVRAKLGAATEESCEVR
jgi:hypothetical protein